MISERTISSVEISEVTKERHMHECSSCMYAVVHTFRSLQEQIKRLRREKTNLQEKIKDLKKIGEEQIRSVAEKIRALEEKVAMLEKESKPLKESANRPA